MAGRQRRRRSRSERQHDDAGRQPGQEQGPTGTDNTVTTNQDTAYTFASADFGFSDATDATPDALKAVKVATLRRGRGRCLDTALP